MPIKRTIHPTRIKTNERIEIYKNPICDTCDISTLPYIEVRKIFNSTDPILLKYITFIVDDNEIQIRRYEKRFYVFGRSFFQRSLESGWFVYKNGKFYGDSSFAQILNYSNKDKIIDHLFDCMGIGWAKEIARTQLLGKMSYPSILKSILCGTIYSEETLVKAIGHRVYKIPNFSWKTLRTFLTSNPRLPRPSIYNIRDFTVDVDITLKRINSTKNHETRNLFYDMLNMAAAEDAKIDFKWSLKRMEAEHLAQIERANSRELEAKDLTEIYEQTVLDELNEHKDIQVISTELAACKEGMMMHHCLYHSYWSRIARYDYMAFHMYAPEDCTFGVRSNMVVQGGEVIAIGPICVDQIYLKYDKSVMPQTREIAEQYVTKHNKLIETLFKQKKQLAIKNGPIDAGEIMPIFMDNDDMPF